MRARIHGVLGILLAGCPADESGGASDTDASTGETSAESSSSSESTSSSSSSSSSAEESSTSTGPMGEFDTRIQPIFSESCGCHLTSVGSGGLSLRAGMAYDNLVGVPSAGAPMFTRVVAGDADASYLIAKLEGTHLEMGGLGAQMPLGGSLSQDIIDEIRAWIDEGAPE
jgi:hypothetical protein